MNITFSKMAFRKKRVVVEDKMQQLNELLNNTLRYLAVVIPFSILLMVLRHEVIQILFQRGKFDAAATGHTATVLIYMLVGSFAFAANTIVPRAYYATQDTLFPAIYGTLAVLLSVPLYLVGLNLMGAGGVALAASLSAILQVAALYAFWNRRSHNDGWPVYSFYLKMTAFSVPLGLVLVKFRAILTNFIDSSTLIGSFSVCMIIATLFALILFNSVKDFSARHFVAVAGDFLWRQKVTKKRFPSLVRYADTLTLQSVRGFADGTFH